MTVWPVQPLFVSICLSLVHFLYLSGMFWRDFQTISLGFAYQSVCQNLKTSWSCQSWEFACCITTSFYLHTLWLSREGYDKRKVVTFQSHVLLCLFSFLFHLSGLTFLCNRRETAAWQMCAMVISSALSVEALFVTSKLFNMTTAPYSSHKSLLCCFNRTCQLLQALLLLCLCQLIDFFFFL